MYGGTVLDEEDIVPDVLHSAADRRVVVRFDAQPALGGDRGRARDRCRDPGGSESGYDQTRRARMDRRNARPHELTVVPLPSFLAKPRASREVARSKAEARFAADVLNALSGDAYSAFIEKLDEETHEKSI